MRIVATADLHGSLPADIPDCDLLLIAGDVCPVQGSHHPMHQLRWLRTEFRDWLERQPARWIVWEAGNHDFGCEGPGFYRIAEREINPPNTQYICDDTIEVGGVTIHGFPWTPNLRNWAFFADTPKFQRLAHEIPQVDIVMIHSPRRRDCQLILMAVILSGPRPHIIHRLHEAPPKLCIYVDTSTRATALARLRDVEFANVAHMDVDVLPDQSARYVSSGPMSRRSSILSPVRALSCSYSARSPSRVAVSYTADSARSCQAAGLTQVVSESMCVGRRACAPQYHLNDLFCGESHAGRL
jgi:hypothetical protein